MLRLKSFCLSYLIGLIGLVFFQFTVYKAEAQCTGVPTYTIDLSANKDSAWVGPTPAVSRGGTNCCSANNCIRFIVTLHPDAEAIRFNIVSGAMPSGALFWQIDCGGERSINERVCVSGAGPHSITFCKPGNNQNVYGVTSIGTPDVGNPTYVSEGCTGQLAATNYDPSSVTWRSIYPDAIGQYNSYLSCTSGCLTPTVTAGANPPEFVDYEVCGIPDGGCSSMTICRVVRATFLNDKTASIIPSDPAICFGGTAATLTAEGTGGLLPYNYLWSTGATTQSIDAGLGTFTVTISDNTNCPPVQATVTVTANPSPVEANAGPDVVSCANNPTATLTGSVVMASGGVWSGGAGTYSPDNTSLTVNYTPTAAEITAGSVTHTLTTTGTGGCPPESDQVLMTIVPTPIVNAGADQTVCANNVAVSLNGSVQNAGGGTWSGGTGSFYPNADALDAVYTPSADEITAGTVTLTLTSTGNGTCNPVSDQMTIIIDQAPVVNAGSDRTVCANNSAVTLAGSVLNAGGGTWSGGSGTYNPDANTLNATYTPSAAERTAGTVTLTLTSTTNGLCNPVSDQMVITITPAPTVNAGVDRTVCANNASLTLNGSFTIADGVIWSGGGTFSDNTSVNSVYTPSAGEITAGTATLTLTTTGNGLCNAVSDQMIITINPAPTVDAGADRTVCGNNAAVALAGSVTVATGGTWSGGTGTFNPNNTTLNATYNPSAAEIAAGTVTLTLTSTGNGLCNAVSDQMVITINPAPVVNAGPDQTVCGNNSNVALNGSVVNAGGGIWSGGSGTFDPGNTALNATYTPSASEITAGSVTLTLTSTTNGLCNAVADQIVITINPTPIVNAGPNQTVCANNSLVTLNGTVQYAGGGVWSAPSGSFADPNALSTTFTPAGPGTVTLTLTSTGNGLCNPVTSQLTVTVTNAPTVNAGIDRTVCGNNPNLTLNGSVTVATGGTWSGGSGVFSPNVNTLNASYTPSAAEIAAGTATLTLTTTGNGQCLPVSDQMTITITPAPTANAGADREVCANNATLTLAGSITVATGGIWSGGAGAFSPNNTTLNATYTPTAAEMAAGTVTLTLTTTGNGLCNAVSDQMVITITPAPTANAGVNRTVCANNSTVTLNGAVTVATGGIWSGGTGTFSPDNTTLNASYTPSTAEISAGTVTLTLTTTGNGLCNPVTSQMTISITPAPVVNAGADMIVCGNNPSVNLNGSVTIATGGIWSGGSGVFSPGNTALNAIYTPSAAEITAGIANLTLTSTGNGNCNAVSDNMQITITTTPTADAGSDQTVCSNNANVTLAGAVTVATGGIWSGGSGSFNPNNTTLNAVYTPSAAERTAGTVTLTLTTTGNGQCNAVSDQMVITITPAPTVNAGPDQTVCANNAVVNLNGSVTVATGAIWSGGAGTFSPNSATLNASYTPTSAEITAGSVTLTLTTTGNGLCTAVSDQMVITITPAPTADAGPDRIVCGNNPNVSLNGIVTVATGGIWVGGDGTFVPDAATLNTTYIPSANEVNATVAALILVTTGNGNCLAARDTMLVIITPPPTVNAGPDQNICRNNLTINLNGTATDYNTVIWTGGAGTFSPAPSELNPSYTPTATEVSAGSVQLTFTAERPGCNPVSDNMIITFTNPPVVNAGPDRTVCANNPNITLAGSVTVATGGIWSGGSGTFNPNASTLNAVYTPSAAEITAGTVTLTLTSTGNGNCNAVTDDMVITITPAPTANAGADQSVCHNNSTVTLNGSVTVSAGGTWTSSGTGTFLPNTNTLNASYLPSLADRDGGTVTLTLTTTGNGLCNAVSDQMVVTITPSPTANAGADRSVCANNPGVVLNGAVTVATGGFWNGGAGTFNPDRNTLNATYTPSASEITSGTVTLTLITTGNGNCNQVSDDMTITITPAPTVNAGPDQSVCGSAASVPINGTVTVATGGTWTTSGTGSFSNANALSTNYLPSATDRVEGNSITLTLTTTGNGNCLAVSDQMIMTFTGVPTVDAGPDKSVCVNDLPIQLEGSGSSATWSGGGGTYNPNNSSFNALYTPTAAEISAGSVTLTLTTDAFGACPPISDQVTITIPPAPVANAGPDQIVCGDIANVDLAGSVSNAAGGIWSTNGTGSFSPNNMTLSTSYTPSAADRTNGSVRMVLTTAGNGFCSAVRDTMFITITPAPTVNAGLDRIVCADAAPIALNGTVTVATGGIWTTSGSGTFSPNSTTLNASYTLSADDINDGTVDLTLTSTGNGTCNPVSSTITITITPAPTADANVDQTICADAASTALNGAVTIATGGVWSTNGTGVFSPNANTLNAGYFPSDADRTAGGVTLTLTTTGNGTCNPVTDQMVLTITPAPVANAGPDVSACADASAVFLNGASVQIATGGTWTTSGTGTFNDPDIVNATYNLTPADIAGGVITLTLTTTGNGTCNPVSDQMMIIITPAPTINAGPDQTVCADVGTVSLNGSVTVATGGTWTTSGDGAFADPNSLSTAYTPSAAERAAGTVTLTLTSTGNGTCMPVSDQMVITITPIPTVDAGADQTICADASGVNLSGAVTVATGGIWSSTGSGTFTPSNANLNTSYVPSAADISAGTVMLTLTTTGNGTCNAYSDQLTVTITPAPTVNAGPDQTVCANNAGVTLNGSVTIATGGIWSGGSGTFDPDETSLTAGYTPSPAEIASGFAVLTLTTTGNGTCNAYSDQMVISVTGAPVVDAGIDRSVCANNPSLTLAGSVTVATGGLWSGGSGTFVPHTAALNAVYTPSAGEISAGTVTLTLGSTGNGLCNPEFDEMTITITPPPTADAGSDQTVCADVAGVQLDGIVTIATGGTWTSSGSGTFSPDANTLNALYHPSSADISAGTVTLTLTTTGNGTCNPVSDQMTITITPAPTVDAGPDRTVCANNVAVSLNGAVTIATGGIWSGGSGTFNPDANTLNATYTPSAGEITAGFVTLTLTTTGNGTCAAVSDNTTIFITPAPVVNAGPDRIVCANNASLALNGSVTGAAGGIWSGGNGTFLPGTTTLNPIYNPSADEISAGVFTLTLTSTGNGNCLAVADDIEITVTPAPTVDAGSDVTVCANNATVVLNGSFTIATGVSWSGGTGSFAPNSTTENATYTPSPGEIGAGTVTLTLTTTGNGNCNAVSDDMTITITPAPTANAGPNQVVCADIAGVQLNGTVTVVLGGTWTTSGSGTFTPDEDALDAVYTPSPADIAGGTVSFTLTTTGNGNCLPVSSQMTLTITPAPTVNAGPDQTHCADITFINLNGSVTVATGGLWTTSGNGTFSPDATTLNANYIPSDDDRAAGNITLTLTTTGNGSCNPISDDLTLIITPAPTVDAGADQTVCADVSGIALNGIVTVASGGQWTTSGTGVFNPNATTLNAAYVPSANDRAVGTVTLTLTTTGNGTCMAVTDQMNITITPAPTVDAGIDRTVCASSPTVVLNGTVTVATGGIWTTGSGTGTFSPDNTTLNATFTASASQIAAGVATLTLTSTGNGTCMPVDDRMFVFIQPLPVVSAGPNQTVCASVISVQLNGTITNASGGTWTTSGTGTFTPDANTLNAQYIPSNADKVAGLVTLTLTSTGNGVCSQVSRNMTLRINPVPTVDAGPATICSDAGGVQLNGVITNAGGGIWTTSGSGTFSPAATALNATYTPSGADIADGQVYLRLTTTGNGPCEAVSDSIELNIIPTPAANAGPDQVVCANTGPVSLNGSVVGATGGQWSSSGGGAFSPDNTTLNASYTPSAVDLTNGGATLTLVTTGVGNCTPHSDQMIISITPAPTANAGPDITVCADTSAVSVSGSVTIASGGTWTTSGDGTFSNANALNTAYTPSPADRTAGTVTLTLTTTGNGLCNPVSDNMVLTLTPAPTVYAGPDDIVCGDVAGLFLNGVVTVATGGTWTSTGTGNFNAPNDLQTAYNLSDADIASGNVELILTSTGNGMCRAVSDTLELIITPAPTISASAGSACADSDTIQLSGSITVATGAVWTSDGSGIFYPDNTTLNAAYIPSDDDKDNGVVTLRLTTTGSGDCEEIFEDVVLNILPAPRADAGPDEIVCADIAGINLNGTIVAAGGGI